LTPLGVVQACVLLMAVWWVWIYTSWVTNWLDPDKTQVRVMLFLLMLAGLVLSISLPEAFTERALAFGTAYASMQVGRSLFALWAFERAGRRADAKNFQRIIIWLSVSGLFWIFGGFAAPAPRLGLWAVALAIEYTGPAVGFFVPGLGRSETTDWAIEGGHLAERCGLFVIIALGESILVTGATLFKHAISGRWQLSHLVGLSLFALAALLAADASPLVLGALATSVLIVVAGWETRSIGDLARR
jgi:low temperature requirement protein LtrA